MPLREREKEKTNPTHWPLKGDKEFLRVNISHFCSFKDQ